MVASLAFQRSAHRSRRLSASISLRYRLLEDGRVLGEGQDILIDQNYLSNPAAYFTPSDPLRYDKLLLASWFEISAFSRCKRRSIIFM